MKEHPPVNISLRSYKAYMSLHIYYIVPYRYVKMTCFWCNGLYSTLMALQALSLFCNLSNIQQRVPNITHLCSITWVLQVWLFQGNIICLKFQV